LSRLHERGLGSVRAVKEDAPDHYATLGLDRSCTLAQIRAAYRLLAKQHHPDVNQGAPQAVTRAQELNAAHEVLSDPARRRAYDRELDAAEERPSRDRSERIQKNIAHDVHLRLEEFFRGTNVEVRVKDPANADGAETYQLEIPAFTAPGTRFRIRREGVFSDGFVQVRVRLFPSARFKPRGSDLRCDLRINARRAAQGGSEMLTGPTGAPLRVEIPAGVARRAVLRIAGEGLPKPRGGRGDLLVRVTYRVEVRSTRTFRS
jgi:DnaJ-class molecular chaperone